MTIQGRFPRRFIETKVQIERVPLVGLMAKDKNGGWRPANGEEVIASEPCSGTGGAGCPCGTCGTCGTCATRRVSGAT